MSDQTDFRAIFEAAPVSYIVVDTEWRIVAVTDSYCADSMRVRDELLGQNILEAFPDNPDDPDASGTKNFRASLERVVASKETEYMPIQRYDLQLPAEEGGGWDERYWRPLNAPVVGADGSVAYVIHGVDNVTAAVKSGQMS